MIAVGSACFGARDYNEISITYVFALLFCRARHDFNDLSEIIRMGAKAKLTTYSPTKTGVLACDRRRLPLRAKPMGGHDPCRHCRRLLQREGVLTFGRCVSGARQSKRGCAQRFTCPYRKSRVPRSICKDRSSSELSTDSPVSVSCFGFAVGTTVETVLWTCMAVSPLVGDLANQVYLLRTAKPRPARAPLVLAQN
jgi:hypothetical protein